MKDQLESPQKEKEKRIMLILADIMMQEHLISPDEKMKIKNLIHRSEEL
jgi:hypothetical protein